MRFGGNKRTNIQFCIYLNHFISLKNKLHFQIEITNTIMKQLFTPIYVGFQHNIQIFAYMQIVNSYWYYNLLLYYTKVLPNIYYLLTANFDIASLRSR